MIKNKMAQESIQINKILLKHLRNLAGENQTDTAYACNLSDRQYQNIESKGSTTSITISRIAEHFNITVDELMTNICADNSLWYVTRPYYIVGDVEQGYNKLLEEIMSKAKDLADIYSPKLAIKNSKQLKEITLSYNNNIEYCWTMRPLLYNKKIGLVWTDLSEWQQDEWNDSFDKLIYGCVYDVHIDDSPLIPKECTSHFLVKFNEVTQSKIVNKGYRLFDTDAEFRVSLTEWVDSNRFIIPSSNQYSGCLYIIYDFLGEMTKSINIFRVWIDEKGKRHQAPWPTSNIEKVIESITDRKDGQRKWAIPIGIGKPLCTEASPMIPEVTELTEIELTLSL